MLKRIDGSFAWEEQTIAEKNFLNAEIRIEKVTFIREEGTEKITFSVECIQHFILAGMHHREVKYIGLSEIDALKAFISAAEQFINQ